MSNEINDGGPAYPNASVKDGLHPGMTLRDYFAGQAMAGIGSREYDHTPNKCDAMVSDAYILADAMIAERNKPCK